MTLDDIVNVIKRIVEPITSKLDKLETNKHKAEMELLEADVKEKEKTSKLKVDPLEKNKKKNETKNERKNETRKEFKMKKVIKE